MTHYHITQENHEAAARSLMESIDLIKKKDKAKTMFVLAQLQREMKQRGGD